MKATRRQNFIAEALVGVLVCTTVQAQQYAIPTSAAEVSGPALGMTMTRAYVQSVGRIAYLWGWPLVNMANRGIASSKAAEPGLLGGVMPIAFGRNAMLTSYVSPEEYFINCPNQDVVSGAGFFALDKGPIVFQVPEFGDRFWVYSLYDARTDEFSEIGQQYGTKPGFYLMVGPSWEGETPAGITAVVHSSTPLVFVAPRIFMEDTLADHAAIQPLVSQVVFYPLSEFDGKTKVKDWSKLPYLPTPESNGEGETKWVNPETFFDELPEVMRQVAPLPSEEGLYQWIGSVLQAAAKDPGIKKVLTETAVASERELITPLFQWRYNGGSVANGWISPANGARWGTDYLSRAAIAMSNMYVNRPDETTYFYNDNDSQGQQLEGRNIYAITFAKGQVPPVKGFWSLTLYNDYHLLSPNLLGRYSLGSKNKNLMYNADGSLTFYAGATSPDISKESNWLPAPNGTFSLYLRAYWPEKAILDGTWQPPKIEKVK